MTTARQGHRHEHELPPLAVDNTIRATERDRLRSLVASDIDRAALLHADDFQLVTPTGATLSKAEYLASVASGEIDYRAWEIVSAIEVRLYGEAAVIRYRSRIDMAIDGDVATFQCWHIDTYEWREGGWQVVWSQATTIRQ